ncbi:MAG: 16S rRNA (adenine(1518)-N(6)/adenine(1519)-N(6))-dimethyltransferase RsmA, partial [Candidatus Omnitrophota bacterium]
PDSGHQDRHPMRPKPKKSLGQNFLVDKNIRKRIIQSAGLKKSDIVLEIGPGRGELTELILEKVKKVIAVEIDPGLCAILRDKFSAYKNFELINRDILKFDIRDFIQKNKKFKVIANLPYYISTPIITHLFEYREVIKEIYLTLQKELASRLTTGPGSKEYGSISCFIQFYSQARILFPIKNTSFWPAPKVDSCFLKLKILLKPKIRVSDEQLFFKLIRTAFNQRRKSLKNSLGPLLPQPLLKDCLKSAKLKPNLRAEDLSLADFARLANRVNQT